ncbi:MAG: hypothetical protein JXQ96_13695 [Cyclobacteriaceae bacterium]
MVELVGYHGTSATAARNIMKAGFEISSGENEWIGNGTYFFIHGLSSKPQDQAQQWGIDESWDNELKSYRYNRFGVVKSDIAVDDNRLWDLTVEGGIEILSYIIEKHKSKIKKLGRYYDYKDGYIIDFARGEGLVDFDAVKGNFYIRFADNRKKKIYLRTPNCTICSIYEPKKNIISSTIIREGDIEK